MKVGFFLHFDFTLKGMLFNELKCYNSIFNNPRVEKIYVFDWKGKYSHMCKDFDFEYQLVYIGGYEDVEKFLKVDVLFTWDWYQDFFAGTISPKGIDLYKIASKFTNEYNRKIVFRICDSKHFMKDYKFMIEERVKYDKSGNFSSRNSGFVDGLNSTQRMNYENVYFLCNGNRNISDWSWETLTHSMPFLEAQYIKKNSVYISDDILFRYTEGYENLSNLNTSVHNRIKKLYHVGNLNGGKVKKIRDVMKNSSVPLVLRTAKRSVNNGLKKYPSIQMVEEPIYRDEMFAELNSYVAYLFVGKGDDSSHYFNKTLYDASIGRTVFLIYSKVDESNIYEKFSMYKFSNEKELKEKFEWIQTDYENHLEYQRKILLENLSTDDLWDIL